MTPIALYYMTAGATVFLSALGCGIGLGIAGLSATSSMTRQPAAIGPSFRALIIGLAFIESSAIIALVSTIISLMSAQHDMTWHQAVASIGGMLAVGIAAMVIGIASSFVVKATAASIARQPLLAQKLITYMLIAQSVIEAPVIFAFIINLLIHTRITPTIGFEQSLQLLAAGLVIAVGCIGPSIGQALCSFSAASAMGTNITSYGRLFPFSLLNQAIIETPMIFCLLTALIILFKPNHSFFNAIQTLVATCSMGLGALGSAIGLGFVARRSTTQIALEPSAYPSIMRATLLSAALIESTAIYALIAALLLLNR